MEHNWKWEPKWGNFWYICLNCGMERWVWKKYKDTDEIESYFRWINGSWTKCEWNECENIIMIDVLE